MDDIKLHSSATCTASQPNIIILSTQTCYFWHFSFLRKCAAKTLVVFFLSHRLRTYITINFSWKNNTTAIQLQYYIVCRLCAQWDVFDKTKNIPTYFESSPATKNTNEINNFRLTDSTSRITNSYTIISAFFLL